MAKYDITAPDGTTWEIEAPDDATEEQVLAYAQSQWQQLQQPTQQSPEPTKRQQMLASRTGRILQGLRDPIDAGAQMLTAALPESVVQAGNRFNNWLADKTGLVGKLPEGGVDQAIREHEQEYQAARQATGQSGLDAYRLVGNIVGTAPLATVMPGATAPSLMTRMASGAGTGALVGAMQPVTEGDLWSGKAKQAGVGAAFGAGTTAALGGLARMIKPNTRPEVKALMQEGVTPTPGQILGGAAQRAEDALTSVPIVGDAIKSSQRRAVEGLNRAALNRALAPIGEKLPKNVKVGHEGVAKVGEMISQAYDDLLPKLRFKADPQFAQEIASLQRLAQNLPEPQAKQFERILQTDVIGKMAPNGGMQGQTLKEVESKLGRLVRSYARSENPDHRMLADAVRETQAAIRRAVERSNPQHADRLRAINQAYANFVRVENAAGRLGSKEGIFSPAGLRGAVRATDSSVRKGQFAKGNALMQDLAEAGESVLGPRVPDSGTPFRLANAAALGGGYLLNPAIPVLTGVASLPYTSVGQKAMAALLTQRPEMAGLLSQGVRTSAPYASGIAGLLAAQQ